MSAALLLAQDEVYFPDGKKMTGFGSFYVPNEYVFKVAHAHPEFLPACSIHPARPDALDELERCLEAGATAMKCLPNCHNIDCNDPRYRRFWQRMADAGLPLLAHTGGEHTVPVIEPKYADPRVLRLPLECGVNMIAAHCATKSGLSDPEYFFVLADMFAEHRTSTPTRVRSMFRSAVAMCANASPKSFRRVSSTGAIFPCRCSATGAGCRASGAPPLSAVVSRSPTSSNGITS